MKYSYVSTAAVLICATTVLSAPLKRSQNSDVSGYGQADYAPYAAQANSGTAQGSSIQSHPLDDLNDDEIDGDEDSGNDQSDNSEFTPSGDSTPDSFDADSSPSADNSGSSSSSPSESRLPPQFKIGTPMRHQANDEPGVTTSNIAARNASTVEPTNNITVDQEKSVGNANAGGPSTVPKQYGDAYNPANGQSNQASGPINAAETQGNGNDGSAKPLYSSDSEWDHYDSEDDSSDAGSHYQPTTAKVSNSIASGNETESASSGFNTPSQQGGNQTPATGHHSSAKDGETQDSSDNDYSGAQDSNSKEDNGRSSSNDNGAGSNSANSQNMVSQIKGVVNSMGQISSELSKMLGTGAGAASSS